MRLQTHCLIKKLSIILDCYKAFSQDFFSKITPIKMNTAAYSRPSITSPSTSSPLESALKSTIQGQEEDAEKYLKQKKVLHILQQLSSMVLFSKPGIKYI